VGDPDEASATIDVPIDESQRQRCDRSQTRIPADMFRAFEGQPMKNAEMSVDGNVLTIKVDLSKEYGPSSSGKTIIVASTEGNVSIPDREEKLGLNVYRKK
jgi:hypothetical protein